MEKSQIQLLVEIILDPNAQDHEKDDAAIDLADSNDNQALEALIKISQSPSENDIFALPNYGEAIATIWLKRNFFNLNIYLSLKGPVRSGICAVLENRKPEWIDKYELIKYGFKD
ncbi:MAG: hypothetical protein WAM28_02965 [Chlamydiales bacterium]